MSAINANVFSRKRENNPSDRNYRTKLKQLIAKEIEREPNIIKINLDCEKEVQAIKSIR